MPDFSLETGLINDGAGLVAGVDEVGRGPLAGPVVAAAVILDQNAVPGALNDSKKLSQKRREKLFDEIMELAISISVASVSSRVIDRINIRQATFLAMKRAVHGLALHPGAVLVDGNAIPPDLGMPADAVIKGDGISSSIAAASIIAKVTRDRMMARYARTFPAYAFERHSGYGTLVHLEAIKRHGICNIHRRSFGPVKAFSHTVGGKVVGNQMALALD